ncbi:MAG: nucleotide exchange factor GrpE [Butyrivibrio sp.]
MDLEENINETVEEQTEATETVPEDDTPNCGEPDESQDESSDEADKEDKKGFFKKKDKKDKRDQQIEELTDRYKRTMAEFDNFRKRTEKEKSAMYEIGARDIIEKLLPVVDNFERGLMAIPEDAKGTPVAEGMDKIYRQLRKMLEDAGVKEIEAEGKEFDPNFHNAVMHVEDENFGDNQIAEVLQKGYIYKETVVRHSMVKVAN